MKINGYQIQHALRELQHERDIAAQNFNTGLFVFEDDDTTLTPEKSFNIYKQCEQKIAKLQVLQARFNLSITVNVLGEIITLHEAVKRVGGAGRGEKMWRMASKKDGKDRYSYRDNVRNKDEIVAKRSVSVVQCIEQAKQAAREASALREAIQTANTTEFDVEDSLASLFSN